MKKAIFPLLLALCLLLSGCGNGAMSELPTPSEDAAVEEATAETASPVEPAPTAALPQWPEADIGAVEPVFSTGELSCEEICACFSELVFSSYEYNEDLDGKSVYKWCSPICCYVSGDADETDTAAIQSFASALDSINGFPGFSVLETDEGANLSLRFCTRTELMDEAGNGYEESDSFLTLEYDDSTCAITGAELLIRSDMLPYVRAALIQRELLRCMGLFGESLHRSDSILSPSYAHISTPSGTDLLLLAILYDEHIACGIDSVSCMAYVRALCK